MVTRKIAGFLTVATMAATILSGCAESKSSVTVSDECAQSLESLAVANTNELLSDQQANNYDLATLRACQSAEEYIEAVLKNPQALGFGSLDRSQVLEYGIGVSCSTLDAQNKTPVCADAQTAKLFNY